MRSGKRYVEYLLPDEHLYSLGVYAQTCAHIEYYICSAICIIEGLGEEDDRWYKRHDELRVKRPKQLASEIRKSLLHFKDDDSWKRYFEDLSSWLSSEENVDARHLAIHGRHYRVGKDIWINAQPKDFRVRETQCFSEDTQAALNIVDSLLRNLVRFVNESDSKG